MNSTLWIMQAVVASALTASGFLIMFLPKKLLANKLSWVNEYSDTMRYFICITKILGALGLILPFYFSIVPILTPVAAVSIAIFMVFALRYHLQKNEYKDVPATLIFFVSTLFIAYYRF